MLFIVLTVLVASTKLAVASCPCEEESLCAPITTVPDKEIFVFLNTVKSESWPMLDWSRITTLSFVYESYTNVADLMCLCHKHSVRLVPLVGLSMPTVNLTSKAERQKWINKNVDYIVSNHLDGINIDVEDAILQNETDIKDGYTHLVLETKLELLKHNVYSQVTVDVSCAPNLSPRYYDYTALSVVSDFLFIMDYDEGYAHPVSANSNYLKNKLGLMWYNQIGVPNHKMVMGLPWYGYGWECSGDTSKGCSPPYYPQTRRGYRSLVQTNENTRSNKLYFQPRHPLPTYCYSDIIKLMKNQTVERKWNQLSQSPSFYFKDGTKVRQMQYDDPESLTIKAAMAVTLGMKGVGVWISDCLDFSDNEEAASERSAMWQTLPAY